MMLLPRQLDPNTTFRVVPNDANIGVLEHQLSMHSFEAVLNEEFLAPEGRSREIVLEVNDGVAEYTITDTLPDGTRVKGPGDLPGFYVAYDESSPLEEIRRIVAYVENEVLPRIYKYEEEWPEGLPSRELRIDPTDIEEGLSEDGLSADVTFEIDVYDTSERYVAERELWKTIYLDGDGDDPEPWQSINFDSTPPGLYLKRIMEVAQLGFKERLEEMISGEERRDIMNLLIASQRLMYVFAEIGDAKPDVLEIDGRKFYGAQNGIFLRNYHKVCKAINNYHCKVQDGVPMRTVYIKLEDILID